MRFTRQRHYNRPSAEHTVKRSMLNNSLAGIAKKIAKVQLNQSRTDSFATSHRSTIQDRNNTDVSDFVTSFHGWRQRLKVRSAPVRTLLFIAFFEPERPP